MITSRDIKGLHVTGDTREEAEREAVNVLALIVCAGHDKGTRTPLGRRISGRVIDCVAFDEVAARLEFSGVTL